MLVSMSSTQSSRGLGGQQLDAEQVLRVARQHVLHAVVARTRRTAVVRAVVVGDVRVLTVEARCDVDGAVIGAAHKHDVAVAGQRCEGA